MQELIALSRSVATELAAQFRGDPRGELAAWLHIAIEREGLVASFYDEHSIEGQFKSLPKRLARSAIAKVNGICANEERHVTAIRALLAAECPWPQVVLEEGWGRLQGIVLGQLASANAMARAIALILLELGARSAHERSAGRAVAGLDTGGFLAFSRTLEITAVESYQRVVALLTALRRRRRPSPYSVALHLQILRILRDERVHRDVLHVLWRACGGDAAAASRAHDADATELPESIANRPIATPADLNAVCRAILTFHYGAALPASALQDDLRRSALDFWRWQMRNPRGKSYFVECQGQDLLQDGARILLLGTAGLAHVVRGVGSIRCHQSQVFEPRELGAHPACVPAGAAVDACDTAEGGTAHGLGFRNRSRVSGEARLDGRVRARAGRAARLRVS